MPDTTKTIPTPAEYATGHAQRRLRKNAAELRVLADKLDGFAEQLAGEPRRGGRVAAEVAGQAIHEHAVWLMNAQLHVAVQYAAEADRYRAEDAR